MSDVFSIHSGPVWRDRSNFIINAKLPETGRFEQLWTRRDEGGLFEICCIPFFLYDVALGDMVSTAAVGVRHYVLSEVVERSGRYVFRVFFEESKLDNRAKTVDDLLHADAQLEWSSGSLLAIDARDESHAQLIANYLWDCQKLGLFEYETGKSA